MNHDRIDRLESLFAQRIAHHTMLKYLIDHNRGDHDIRQVCRCLYRAARRVAVALDEPFYYEPKQGTLLRNRRSGKLFRVLKVYGEDGAIPIYDLEQVSPIVGNSSRYDQLTQETLFDRYRILEDIE